jgi:GGDEF domain-containing protein
VTALADRIVAALAEPVDHDGERLEMGASVGATIAERGTLDPTKVLATADQALYESKAAGRGRWRLA